MLLYAETFDKNPIATMDDAVAIVSASGVYISARWMIRTFIWDAYKAGRFGQPHDGDYHEKHIKWLLEQSIESIDYRRGEGFKLPGKDKNDGLETALYHSVATNHNLSASVKTVEVGRRQRRTRRCDPDERRDDQAPRGRAQSGEGGSGGVGSDQGGDTGDTSFDQGVYGSDEVQDWREGHYQALVRL
jgi:hypothetical protein